MSYNITKIELYNVNEDGEAVWNCYATTDVINNYQVEVTKSLLMKIYNFLN
jgi:hypothetical protein